MKVHECKSQLCRVTFVLSGGLGFPVWEMSGVGECTGSFLLAWARTKCWFLFCIIELNKKITVSINNIYQIFPTCDLTLPDWKSVKNPQKTTVAINSSHPAEHLCSHQCPECIRVSPADRCLGTVEVVVEQHLESICPLCTFPEQQGSEAENYISQMPLQLRLWRQIGLHQWDRYRHVKFSRRKEGGMWVRPWQMKFTGAWDAE